VKYFEECGAKEEIFTLPLCRECEKEIHPGDKVYGRNDTESFLCYECGQEEV